MMECFGLSDTGCVRTNNEDYFQVAPELGLCVLADGMGGARAGEKASQLAVETVIQRVRDSGRRDSQALLEAIEAANREVLGMARADPTLEGMGTTLVAVLDLDDEILVASVGDSRAYLLDQESFRVVTEDQSWVNEVGRPMGLDEGTLKTHPLRHVLTMAIGAGAHLVVNCYMQPWKPGSLLLLSSDGLHGVVPLERIEEIMRSSNGEGRALEVKCRRLIELAREAGGPDNITAVLVRRSVWPPAPTP